MVIDKIFSLQYYAVEGRKRLVDADRSDRGISGKVGGPEVEIKFMSLWRLKRQSFDLSIQRCFGFS